MKAIDVRQKLEALLDGKIGTFANGQSAIWVGSNPPQGKVTGIEVSIAEVPIANKNAHPVSGGLVFLDQSWRVTIVNYDRSKSLAEIVRIVNRLSPRNLSWQSATLSTFEQITFEIFDPGFIAREGFSSSVDPIVPIPPIPPDPGTAPETVFEIPFSFGDASPKPIGLPIAGFIQSCSIVISTPFNGAPSTLRLGTQIVPPLLIPAEYVDPYSSGDYETYPLIKFDAPTQIVLTIQLGLGVTQGNGIVLINYAQV